MRKLDASVEWQVIASSDNADALSFATEAFEYRSLRLQDERQQQVTLYARSQTDPHQRLVLGVFDTPAQADLFVSLHQQNPLFVPALKAAFDWPEDPLTVVHYEGVYRVGMKSYRVQALSESGWRVEYIEGYRAQLLGDAISATDACMMVYNHFDGRLRGCKLC